MITFDWYYLVPAAAIVVGCIQWIKGYDVKNTVPVWVWRSLMPLVCAGIAVAGGAGQIWQQWASNAAALIMLSEAGYPILIQLPKEIINMVRAKIIPGVEVK